MTEIATCALCGEPMPPGEEMFKYHGYSGPCPKPPLSRHPEPLTGGYGLGGDGRTPIEERLLYHREDQATGKMVLRNEDGPEAADTIARLRERVAELEGEDFGKYVKRVEAERDEARGLAIQAPALLNEIAALKAAGTRADGIEAAAKVCDQYSDEAAAQGLDDRAAVAAVLATDIRDLKTGDHSSAKPASGWRTMETAPRDGTCVILCDIAGGVGEARFYPDNDGWWWAGTDPSDAHDGQVIDPVAYQRLPMPPLQLPSPLGGAT